MEAIDCLYEAFPASAKDIRLNLSSVLQGGALDDAQRWGVAVACAVTERSVALHEAVLHDAAARGGGDGIDEARAAAARREAVLPDAAARVGDDVIEGARAAAALMAMNNVYYRFRHLVGKESYTT